MAKKSKGGDPWRAETDISYSSARNLARQEELTGYSSLPSEMAKNLARGKPLPPGIAKRSVPCGILERLPSYPGYEWKRVGVNLVMIALSTAMVKHVFD